MVLFFAEVHMQLQAELKTDISLGSPNKIMRALAVPYVGH